MSSTMVSSSVMSIPATPNLATLGKAAVEKIVYGVKTIILDCAGVLWVGDSPIPDAPEVVNRLKKKGIQVILFSNNSTRNRNDFVIKAKSMGYEVEIEDIVTTASMAIAYLKQKGFKQTVYLIGSRGIAEELEAAGYKHLGIGPDVLQHSMAQTVETFKPDRNVGAVIVGYDEHFCYTKLLRATSYLNKPHCHFLATNLDERCPLNSGIVVPGTGAIVRAVETATHRQAVLLGKPHYSAFDILRIDKGLIPNKTMIIGDRASTDIYFGNTCGFTTVLVLTGATKDSNFDKKKGGTRRSYREYFPDYYVESLGNLLQFLD